MKYFETKHEKNSARITALFAIILVLLIFIAGPKYLDPPIEYGVAVNFGTTDYGSGNIQPKKPIKSEVKEVIKQPEVVESQPESSKPKQVNEDVVTQDNEESIAIKKQEEAEAKAKAEAKAEADRIAKEKRELEEKKKKLDALIGGISKSEGTDAGSEGNDNQPGDKGQLDGDPYAPSYFGEPGSGGGGTGYGLRGRGKPTKTKVLPECDEEGSVVVEIHVNREGRVVNAIPGKRGTTGNICLYQAAKKTALTYKWPSDSKAPSKQVGFVIINFSVSD
ncbi:MAG: energy transducer TonB [Bacteroidetes bacterium]|nr:energy transducer TonB [Bacteroidota bacterium]